MKEKLIDRLYDFWKSYIEYYNLDNKDLKENITQAVNKGEQGAEELLDWCRNEFEYFQSNMYTEMEENLNRIWDICNWYLDYIQNNKMTEKNLLELIENY